MHELPNLIENIRTALAFSESVPPDKLAQYARQYAEECRKLNERLQRCLPYLRGGNVAEAVRLAEAQPHITETFNLLDFENRQGWVEICDALGFDVPQPLAVDIFHELNDAYLQRASLDPLLKWHRLFALNGSPLRERLTVLRSLAKSDPMNLFWQTDQETFEKARILEIHRDVADALAHDNMPRLQKLYRELTAPGWLITPPPEYRQQICTAVLEKYAAELMQAFSAFDYSEAEAVYQSMQQVLVTNRMGMPTAIEENIRAAVQWLHETTHEQYFLAQFHREAATLQETLDGTATRQTLENLYYSLQNTAVQAKQVIPQDLDWHYHSRMDYLSRVEKYRYGIVITAFAGSILLVAAFLIYALVERSFAEQVAQTLETLQSIETENRIDDIEPTLKTIKPKVAQSPNVEPIIARLQGTRDKDNVRAKTFEHYWGQADRLMEQRSDSEGLKAAKASVDQANALKRTPQEMTLYTDLRSKYDRLFAQLQLDADRTFSGLFVQYNQEFNDLPRSANEQYQPDELLEQLTTLAVNVQNLLSQHSDISDRQKREGESLLDSIDNRQKTIQQAAKETDAFKQIASQIRDLPSSKKILLDFVTKYPKHPAADDIKNLLKDFDSIQDAAESLQTLCRSYVTATTDFLQRRSAAPNIKNQYDTAVAKIANIESVFSAADDVLTLANMKPIDDNTFKATEALLKTIAQKDLYPWIDERKNWYYLTAQPVIDASGRVSNTNIEYVTAFGATPKKYTLTSNNAEQNKGNYDVRQSTFAGEALNQLDNLTTDTNVQKDAAEIIGRLLVKMNDAQGIDPILKIVLFHTFILDYSAVDPIFAEKFKRLTKLIDDSDVDFSVNWMDVESRSVPTQRQKADVILRRFAGTAEVKTLADNTKKETNSFRQKLLETSPKFEFVGVLTKQGQWSLPVEKLSADTGKLFTLQMLGDKVQAVQVGTVRDGNIVLSNSITVLQCSPVFLGD